MSVGNVVTDFMQLGYNELEFYRKGILDLTQMGTEAITTKGEYIGDDLEFRGIHLSFDI